MGDIDRCRHDNPSPPPSRQTEAAESRNTARAADPPAGGGETKPVTIGFAISKLRHTPSKEVKAEERRRWKALRSGLHPGTGERLRPGDEKSLKSMERYRLQMHREAQRDAPWTSKMAMGHYDQVPSDYHQRFLDPLLDRSFVKRIAGGIDAELIRLASQRREEEALCELRNQVHRAATTFITNVWKDSWETHEYGTGIGRLDDPQLMQTEAERLLSIYGPRLVDQVGFLSEYNRNLELFSPTLTPRDFERADLLARVALPMQFCTGFDAYQADNINALRRYAGSLLLQWNKDFSKTKNPVFAWKAYRTARQCGVDVPDWVLDALESTAEAINELGERVDEGEALGKEADEVGRALGFGNKPRGTTGLFAAANQLERDRDIYFAVMDWIEERRSEHSDRRPKLSVAYAEVAQEFNCSASKVGEAYRRMKDYAGGEQESDE
jgi:hypothetical protein